MTRIPMTAEATEAARQSATPSRPAFSMNPRTRALMELLDSQVQTAASALTGVMATLDMLREMPPQRPQPAGPVVPQGKAPPLVFGSPAAVVASPPPGTAGDDAPTRTECADHPISGD